MDIKIDDTRPYGEVHGEHEHNARWEQDGLLFGADLRVIEATLTDADRARIEKRAKVAAAKVRAETIMREALGEEAPGEIVRIATTAAEANDAEGVDLTEWAAAVNRGESPPIRFDLITAECRKRWNKSPANKKQALRLIASDGATDFGELAA
jgi:hypothetical protein